MDNFCQFPAYVLASALMRIYLDTEFIERGHRHPLELVSVGLVSEDGRELYVVLEDGWHPDHANEWVRLNVLPYLGSGPRTPRSEAALLIRGFVGESPQFWGYYADYDWVVICQLFGAMVDLPEGWPMYCRDLKQLCDSMGNPRLPKQEGTEHNALSDARHVKAMYDWLGEFAQRDPGTVS